MLSEPGFCYVIRTWIGLNFHWFHQNSCYFSAMVLRFIKDIPTFSRFFLDIPTFFALYLRYQHICVVSEVSRHKSTDVDAEFDEEQR